MTRCSILLLFSCVFLILLINPTYASQNVSINLPSCRFTITIPQGWDSIPQDVILKKNGTALPCFGFYPKQQGDYFKEIYVLVSFLTTANVLNGFTFEEIARNLKRMNEQSKMPNTDSLRMVYNGTDKYTHGGKFYIRTLTTIYKDTVTLKCLQDLLLTRYGYISIVCYKKGRTEDIFRDAATSITQGISIQNDYIYTEPQGQTAFTLIKIIISLCIGMAVYFIIILTGIRKKRAR